LGHEWDCDPALQDALTDIGERVTQAFETMQPRPGSEQYWRAGLHLKVIKEE
jgi:hypothetical protein